MPLNCHPGLRESFQAPGPGWYQCDDGVEMDDEDVVVAIGGKPLDPDRIYRVGSFIDFDHDFSAGCGGSSDPHRFNFEVEATKLASLEKFYGKGFVVLF